MKAVPLVTVRVSKGQDGELRAQICKASTADRTVAISEFNEAMQSAIRHAGPGQTIACLPNAAPSPLNVQPAPVQTPPAPPPRPAAGTPASAPARATAAPAPNEVLDNNPYNFAEWAGMEPWLPPEPHAPGALHDRWWPAAERLSGTIGLRLQARSPIFVPEGVLPEPPPEKPRRFWRCFDPNGDERCAIPGSSVKGAIRTLVETLTNSALTLVNSGDYIEPIAYRRRSAVLWAIESSDAAGLILFRSQALFAKKLPNGQWEASPKGRQQLPADAVPQHRDTIDPNDRTTWQAIALRANLLWTPDHSHGSTHLIIRVTNTQATVSADLMKRYRAYVDRSLAIKDHLKRVADLTSTGFGRNYYQPRDLSRETVHFESRKDDLKRLDRGDYVFGIPDPGAPTTLACLGKNLNFMWSDENSPQDLVGAFYPKNEQKSTLETASIAEATFGFAGSYRDEGHPFRGRVRFGTFWATRNPVELGPIQLESLTAPTGVKLKARSLYLPPGTDGKAQTYAEATRLRGRKFYWHQRAGDDRVHEPHKAETGGGQRPAPILPLATDTRFEGVVAFDNLTKIELGCLLAALSPDRLFAGGADEQFGWKVGKAKPRGLGSVHATITSVHQRRDAAEAFASPLADPLREVPLNEQGAYVDAFTAWLDAEANKLPTPVRSWRELSFIKDLARLLRLPIALHLRSYAEIPAISGPPPDFDNAAGDPRGGRSNRPTAMRPARELS